MVDVAHNGDYRCPRLKVSRLGRVLGTLERLYLGH
jgi:hypothetical protein